MSRIYDKVIRYGKTNSRVTHLWRELMPNFGWRLANSNPQRASRTGFVHGGMVFLVSFTDLMINK